VFWVYGLEALLTLPLCVLGYFEGGLVGACAGCLLGHVLAAVLTFVLALGRFGLPFAMGHLVRISAGTVAMVFALKTIPWPHTLLGLALEAVAGGGIYLLAIGFLYRGDLGSMLEGRRALQTPTEECA
jgi:hypothetical protein